MKYYNVFITRNFPKISKHPLFDAWGVYANSKKEAIEIAKKQMEDHDVKYIKIYGAIRNKDKE